MIAKTLCLFWVVLIVAGCSQEETAAKPVSEASDDPNMSLASGGRQDPDGTFLIEIQPRVYSSEDPCMILSDSEGNTFSMTYERVQFVLGTAQYEATLGYRPGEGFPIELDSAKTYRFRLKPTGVQASRAGFIDCKVLEVWDGKELIYKRDTRSPVKKP